MTGSGWVRERFASVLRFASRFATVSSVIHAPMELLDKTVSMVLAAVTPVSAVAAC
jgi:hypothetical protein